MDNTIDEFHNEISINTIKIQIPISISKDNAFLYGNLSIFSNTKTLVIFVHGSGSSGYSPRNQYLSKILNDSRIGTLLIDLLTVEEANIDNDTKEYRFNIGLLTNRLVVITDWLVRYHDTKLLHIGYFGASTGAAAALMASIQRPDIIKVIVSRAGRPDLANSNDLTKISSSTLFVVGEKDSKIVEINKKALEQLKNTSQKKIIIIPGATHLFEENGKLEQVARIATGWFKSYL